MHITKRAYSDVRGKRVYDEAGTRHLYLTKFETAVPNFEAFAVETLPARGRFEKHRYVGVEVFILVLQGQGTIHSSQETYDYAPRDFFVVDAGVWYSIQNTSKEEASVFVMVQMKIDDMHVPKNKRGDDDAF